MIESDRSSTTETCNRAVSVVTKQFPFPGYMESARCGYVSVGMHCLGLLSSGSEILDFGSGPCDKSAVLASLGYQCTAVDDLSDDWHLIGDNRHKIKAFASNHGVNLIVTDKSLEAVRGRVFDMVMLHDVIEHFADSPRSLLLDLIQLLRPHGYLYITVPNAVNLRKRLLVLLGKTNYPRFGAYYWCRETWRGHKREYVKDDLRALCSYLGLDQVLLQGQHHRLRALPRGSHWLYQKTFGLIDSLRDTLALIVRKPANWKPMALTLEQEHEIRQRETPYRYDAALTSVRRKHIESPVAAGDDLPS